MGAWQVSRILPAAASPKTGIAVFLKIKENVQDSYLRRISIHETLISRSICLLWAKITSDAHISISNPPSAWWVGSPVIRCAGWVPDADVCVAGDLAQRRHMLLEMRVSWMLIHEINNLVQAFQKNQVVLLFKRTRHA